MTRVSAAGRRSVYRAVAERAPDSFRRDPPPCPPKPPRRLAPSGIAIIAQQGRIGGNQQRIAWIGADRGELVSQSAPALCLPQQHHASIRRDAPTIKSGGDLLAIHGWNREREKAIFCHGGYGLDAIV
jgi:hypothetical protein